MNALFSSPGGLVADFFGGSVHNLLAVAEKLGRRWIGCDLGRWAIHVTRKRLLGIENCKPFEVLNLGKYERQYWQGVTFGEAKDKPLTEQASTSTSPSSSSSTAPSRWRAWRTCTARRARPWSTSARWTRR